MSGKNDITAPVCYLVPMPLGRIEDASFRSIEALKRCSLLLCEDTKDMFFLLKRAGVDPRGKKMIVIGDAVESAVMQEIDHAIKKKTAFGIVSSGGIPGYYDPGKCYIDLLTTAYKNKITLVDIAGPSALTHAIMLSSVIFGPAIVLDKYGHDKPYTDPVLMRKADEVPLISFIEIERDTKQYAGSPLAAAIALLRKTIAKPLYIEVFSDLSRPDLLILKGPLPKVEKRLRTLDMTAHEFVLVCTTEAYRQKVLHGTERY